MVEKTAEKKGSRTTWFIIGAVLGCLIGALFGFAAFYFLIYEAMRHQ